MLRYTSLAIAVTLTAYAGSPALGQAPKFLQRTSQQWAGQLKSAKPGERRNAAFALGKLGKYAVSSVPDLQQMVSQEPDAGTREAIVLAIGEIAADSESLDGQAEGALIDALQRDQDRLVRRSAALSLGLASKSDKSRTALSQALTDPEQVVRQNAAWALGRRDAKAAPALVRALQDGTCDSLVKRDAANALFAVANNEPEAMRPALTALLAMCQDRDPEVRKAGLTPLVKIIGSKDMQALPILKAVLRDPDAEVRRFAALALSNVGGAAAAEAVPILIDALRNGEPHLKRSATIALHNIGETAAPAIPILIKLLEDPDEGLCKNAAVALGGIGKVAGPAVPALVKVVTDARQTLDLRVAAAEALTDMGDLPEIRKELSALLTVLGNAKEDGDLRARLAWLYNPFFTHKAIMDAARPTMDRVCAESGTKDNGMARYQCAYLLGLRFRQEAPDSALNVLQEWLFDDTGKIYEGLELRPGGSSSEKKGKDETTQRVVGDSRTMAVQALSLMGRDRVANRKDIVEQLRRLANDAKTHKELREKSGELIRKLGV
jgi:HEAT repeat protein